MSFPPNNDINKHPISSAKTYTSPYPAVMDDNSTGRKTHKRERSTTDASPTKGQSQKKQHRTMNPAFTPNKPSGSTNKAASQDISTPSTHPSDLETARRLQALQAMQAQRLASAGRNAMAPPPTNSASRNIGTPNVSSVDLETHRRRLALFNIAQREAARRNGTAPPGMTFATGSRSGRDGTAPPGVRSAPRESTMRRELSGSGVPTPPRNLAGRDAMVPAGFRPRETVRRDSSMASSPSAVAFGAARRNPDVPGFRPASRENTSRDRPAAPLGTIPTFPFEAAARNNSTFPPPTTTEPPATTTTTSTAEHLAHCAHFMAGIFTVHDFYMAQGAEQGRSREETAAEICAALTQMKHRFEDGESWESLESGRRAVLCRDGRYRLPRVE